MQRLLIAAAAVLVALYGLRAVNSQAPGESGVYNCTVSVEAFSCTRMSTPTEPGSATPTHTPTTTPPTPTATSVPSTATPSATRTFTATPTRTLTPTITTTPTATLPPTGYTVDNLLADSVGTHDIRPCNVSGFDWEFRGVVQSVGPGSRTAAGAWFAYQWDCGRQQAGVTVSLRNLRGYAWTGSAWVEYQRDVDWCNMMVPPGGPFGADCTLGANPTWTMPNEHRSIHGATSIVTYPAGTQCLVTTGEAKQNGTARVAMHFGADWGFPGRTAGGAVVGRFRMLTSAYVFFGASSCPAAILRANPPPGVSP